MKNILMIGKPGGNLVRTYEWHMEALNNDSKKRFKVDCINTLKGNIDVSSYDIFWFYAKAFHPQTYNQIKNYRPDAKFIFGPNILLDKPDVGISDEWDNWYINHCQQDLHLDQVDFYSEHVKKFLNENTRQVSRVLDKCMKLDDSLYDENSEKIYDCLLYSKKRRYDYFFEEFREKLINLLEKNSIKYCEVKAGKFGSYTREEYFYLLNQSKVTVNLSLDECPGILNYESMFFNVPVIGSPHNVPVTSCKELIVSNTDKMTDEYLVRSELAAEKYFEKIQWFLENKDKLNDLDHRNWVKNHTSFEKYSDSVYSLLKREFKWD